MKSIFSFILISLMAMSSWAEKKSAYIESDSSEEKSPEKKFENFDKVIKVKNLGELRLKYDYFGEPVSQPARLVISLSCSGNASDVKIDELKICEIKDYKYESGPKVLTVNFISSRVDEGGRVHCDQSDERQFKLARICKQKSPKK